MTLHMTRTDVTTEIRDLLEDWAAGARADTESATVASS